MAVARQRMPTRPADERAHTFDEVNTGLGHDEALIEAMRCLQCTRAWCVDACPVHVDIPAMLDRLADDDLVGAARSLLSDNALPCVTGRVCPQEIQCEGACLRGRRGEPVAIGHLERYLADWAADHPDLVEPATGVAPNGRSVAVVGSGPGGLDRGRRAGPHGSRGHRVRGLPRRRTASSATASPRSGCPVTSRRARSPGSSGWVSSSRPMRWSVGRTTSTSCAETSTRCSSP